MLEKMLDGTGASEKELHTVGILTDIAKDLVDYDLMCEKLHMMKNGGKWDDPEDAMPRSVPMDNPKPSKY